MAPTILIVEDEEAIATLLVAVFEEEGYRVVAAADGLAALSRAAEHRPDLVLSDVMMPGLDGPGLARALVADPAFGGIPLVLMSALHEPHTAGAPYAAFIRKPFDLDTLLALVARLLDRPTIGR